MKFLKSRFAMNISNFQIFRFARAQVFLTTWIFIIYNVANCTKSLWCPDQKIVKFYGFSWYFIWVPKKSLVLVQLVNGLDLARSKLDCSCQQVLLHSLLIFSFCHHCNTFGQSPSQTDLSHSATQFLSQLCKCFIFQHWKENRQKS